MENFLMGAISMESVIAALFFFRFWRDTHDRLFVMFGAAFVLLAFTRLGLALSSSPVEGQTHWYLARLAAFVLILVAIIDKNRR